MISFARKFVASAALSRRASVNTVEGVGLPKPTCRLAFSFHNSSTICRGTSTGLAEPIELKQRVIACRSTTGFSDR